MERIAMHQSFPRRGYGTHVGSWIPAITAHVKTWFKACTDYYAAAARYEQLARLSDAELERRRLSRETLARTVCEGCERKRHR